MADINGIAWFEIGTDDPATAERFYGEVFGWSVAHDGAASTDPAYQVITTSSGPNLGAGYDRNQAPRTRSR